MSDYPITPIDADCDLDFDASSMSAVGGSVVFSSISIVSPVVFFGTTYSPSVKPAVGRLVLPKLLSSSYPTYRPKQGEILCGEPDLFQGNVLSPVSPTKLWEPFIPWNASSYPPGVGGVVTIDATGRLTDNVSQLYFDPVKFLLGIGTNAPTGSLSINFQQNTYPAIVIKPQSGSPTVDVVDINNSSNVTQVSINSLFKVIFRASTTSTASFNIPSGVSPTTPVAGDIWWDGTHLYFFDGVTSHDLLASGGGGGYPALTTRNFITSGGGTSLTTSFATILSDTLPDIGTYLIIGVCAADLANTNGGASGTVTGQIVVGGATISTNFQQLSISVTQTANFVVMGLATTVAINKAVDLNMMRSGTSGFIATVDSGTSLLWIRID
jgi:hypothetical protein